MNNKSLKLLVASACVLSLAGASFGSEGASSNKVSYSATPMIRYADVDGNAKLFREHMGFEDGLSGGLEELSIATKYQDLEIHLGGKALFNDEEYGLHLEIAKPDAWFLHASFGQWRKYFNDVGGHYELFTQPSQKLDKDLYLDVGHLAVEFGLTPPNMPKVVFGWEREYKHGDTSSLAWGGVNQTLSTNAVTPVGAAGVPVGTRPLGSVSKNIYPAYKNLNETLDVFSIDLEHTIKKVNIGNQFRYEKFDATGVYREKRVFPLYTPGSLTSSNITIRESFDQDAINNFFNLDSHLNDWAYWSLGYMFQKSEGNMGDSVYYQGFPNGSNMRNWQRIDADVDQDTHQVNLNLMVGPFKKTGLAAYAGIETELTDRNGQTLFLRNHKPGGAETLEDVQIDADTDRNRLTENLGVRFTKIPFTTIYAEGKWTQEDIGMQESELRWNRLTNVVLVTPTVRLDRDTDTDVDRQQYTLGVNTAPWRKVNLSGRYRHSIRNNDYDHKRDLESGSPDGYSAFITEQEFTTDEVMAKITVRPLPQLSVSLQYQWITTEIETETQDYASGPPGTVESGDYDASIYSAHVGWSPLARLYLSGSFSFQDISSSSYDNGVRSMIEYQEDVYTLMTSATFALDNKTDLTAQYIYSWADNYDNNGYSYTPGSYTSPNDYGLPLGTDFRRTGVTLSLARQLRENIVARLHYGFYDYNEPHTGGINDYQAHVTGASCTVRF